MPEENNTPPEENVADAEFGNLSNTNPPTAKQEDQQQNLEMMFDVPVQINAELGNSYIKIRDLINLCPGSVIELERVAGEPVEIQVNGVLIGKGDVVVVNDNFGVRITEIIGTEERIKQLAE